MRILEAGHYSAKGPTIWSVIGWEIMLEVRCENDKSLLFIDDVHPLENVSADERSLPTVKFDPRHDFLVLESDVISKALQVLSILQTLPKKRAARMNSGRWFCSGSSLVTEAGLPSCVLLDAGLTLLKNQLGFWEGVNILPYFYEDEQRKLLRLIAKALPEFRLQVILYDRAGRYWNIAHKM